VHSAYGFDLLCQTFDLGMTLSVLLFKIFRSSTWAPILLYCLYDPSSKDVIFDGVSNHSPLGSFPLPLPKDSSMNDSQHIIVGISLLQFDVPPPIDVPTMEISSTLLLNLMDSPYSAHMAVHISNWTVPIPRCDDLIISATTFGYIVYVPRVGGFPMDASFYCDAFAQWLKQSFAQ
jgi:hypothetical protein